MHLNIEDKNFLQIHVSGRKTNPKMVEAETHAMILVVKKEQQKCLSQVSDRPIFA
jgi:hypothetical protein